MTLGVLHAPSIVMTGLVPQLSGSCGTEIEVDLFEIRRWMVLDVTQVRDVLAMHEIGANESRRVEKTSRSLSGLGDSM